MLEVLPIGSSIVKDQNTLFFTWLAPAGQSGMGNGEWGMENWEWERRGRTL